MKNSLSGGSISSWTPDIPYCDYPGVACNESGNVIKMDFSEWSLSGTFPPDVCAYLPALRVLQLDLSSTNLGGAVPNLSGLKSLRLLDMSYNLFSGKFPISKLTRLTRLKGMILSTSSITGTIPSWIGNMTSLTDLELSGNSLTGWIPSTIGRLENLEWLELYYNQLDGVMPDELGNLTRLHDIDVSVNRLTGTIPWSLCELPKLKVLQLYNNCLTGEIPASIGNSTSLTSLSLYKNFLTGELPAHLGEFSELVVLELSENRLFGELPRENYVKCESLLRFRAIGNAKNLSALFLQSNRISSSLPSDISGAKRLVKIDLSNNLLAGPVPPEIGELKTLNLLLLQDNKLSSSIPESLSSLRSLNVLNLSNNLLTGPIPDFTSFHKLSFKKHEIVQALIEKNIVGHGGSGTVYKIELSDRKSVAVKKLWTRKTKDPTLDKLLDRQLKSEVETLGSIRHKNIVKLYCCFSSLDTNLLVYEYMPNGNLWDALHGEQCFLDWPTRHQIALGVAQGLAYLHHDLQPPIVHRDIKSTNILLNVDFQPKVADFGIAKVLQEKGAGKDSSTTIIAGTTGYFAPGNSLNSSRIFMHHHN
ncbi:Receptor-like protein kinase 5 [Acorus gramineus]|uniref:non-specific serine/threonine protein kinase n=1 Tax=Acorus gramineus TaxID=55184 RepID=A0AAV9B297_ACOGR|nr:Receptor-like protein kinase 5 [Acorus gramineus]